MHGQQNIKNVFFMHPYSSVFSRTCFRACDSSLVIIGKRILTQYCSGDKIGKKEMGGARSTYEGEERRIQGFGGFHILMQNCCTELGE